MRLSMQMLCDRLKQYDPEPDIRKNGRHLQSVRLFSENLRYTPSTLYLTPMEWGRIVCSNENDILVLHTDDINEVSNEILDVFEYFQNEEDRASELIGKGCSEKELLELLADMTGFFLILADASFYMRETAGPDHIADRHPGLKQMIGEHMIPLPALREINTEPKIRMHGELPYLMTVPGLGTACVANLFANGRHEGWLVACKETPEYTEGERDLLDCAARIMERWFQSNEHAEEQSNRAGILLDLLHGRDGEESRIKDRLQTLRWMGSDRKQLFAVRLNDGLTVPADTAVRKLEALFPDALSLMHNGNILLLLNYALTGERESQGRLLQFLGEIQCNAGKSDVFQDIMTVKEQADVAVTAAAFAGKETPLCGFADIALPYMASVLREHALPSLSHPALTILENYGREHDAAFLKTLQVFLEENCSHTAAARELFIHRSTLLYRLDRIVELTGINLADPEERFRLLLSFYMKKRW